MFRPKVVEQAGRPERPYIRPSNYLRTAMIALCFRVGLTFDGEIIPNFTRTMLRHYEQVFNFKEADTVYRLY